MLPENVRVDDFTIGGITNANKVSGLQVVKVKKKKKEKNQVNVKLVTTRCLVPLIKGVSFG